MSPTHKMPEGAAATRAAALAELDATLAAARCAVSVAAPCIRDFTTRALLHVAVQQLDRAERAARRLDD